MSGQIELIRTALRVPSELHRRIHEAAADSGRTFNAEILQRLQQSFEEPRHALSRSEALELDLKRHVASNALIAARSEIHNLHIRLELLWLRERQAASEQERMAANKEMQDIQLRLDHARHEEHTAARYLAEMQEALAMNRGQTQQGSSQPSEWPQYASEDQQNDRK